jgi:hypothetical protein
MCSAPFLTNCRDHDLISPVCRQSVKNFRCQKLGILVRTGTGNLWQARCAEPLPMQYVHRYHAPSYFLFIYFFYRRYRTYGEIPQYGTRIQYCVRFLPWRGIFGATRILFPCTGTDPTWDKRRPSNGVCVMPVLNSKLLAPFLALVGEPGTVLG